jgi:hypothetical protein
VGSLGHLRRIGERGMRVLVMGLIRAAIIAISLMLVLLSPSREEALQPVIIILPLGHIKIVRCR